MSQDLWQPIILKCEGFDMFGSIMQMFTGNSEKQRKDLKVSHLIKAALAGRLDEEVNKQLRQTIPLHRSGGDSSGKKYFDSHIYVIRTC
jgi:hypothetical protein